MIRIEVLLALHSLLFVDTGYAAPLPSENGDTLNSSISNGKTKLKVMT